MTLNIFFPLKIGKSVKKIDYWIICSSITSMQWKILFQKKKEEKNRYQNNKGQKRRQQKAKQKGRLNF